jgi:hypothetical protein
MDYKATFKAGAAKLDALQADYAAEEQKLVEKGQEISHLAEAMSHLSPLAGEKLVLNEVITEILHSVKQVEALDVGITEKIRQVLQAKSTQAFFPTGVRTELETAKYDLSKYPNTMATIHSVLKRLVEQKQVLQAPQQDGRMAYIWNVAKK